MKDYKQSQELTEINFDWGINMHTVSQEIMSARYKAKQRVVPPPGRVRNLEGYSI